jgi:hypothetical protein
MAAAAVTDDPARVNKRLKRFESDASSSPALPPTSLRDAFTLGGDDLGVRGLGARGRFALVGSGAQLAGSLATQDDAEWNAAVVVGTCTDLEKRYFRLTSVRIADTERRNHVACLLIVTRAPALRVGRCSGAQSRQGQAAPYPATDAGAAETQVAERGRLHLHMRPVQVDAPGPDRTTDPQLRAARTDA